MYETRCIASLQCLGRAMLYDKSYRETQTEMGRIVFGIIVGVVLVPLAAMGWFRWGHPPVAVADKPLPFERQITHVPLGARIEREMPGNPPIPADEKNFLAGAQIYRDDCAACHGFHGKASVFAKHMYPSAPQLWETHRNSSVVGVSDDPPGETFWKADNGIRLSGMPAFHDVLSETQIWQVSLLLANADKPLPPDVLQIVRGEQGTAATPAPATQKP
jgi:thiosulfate dehydrogenase